MDARLNKYGNNQNRQFIFEPPVTIEAGGHLFADEVAMTYKVFSAEGVMVQQGILVETHDFMASGDVAAHPIFTATFPSSEDWPEIIGD